MADPILGADPHAVLARAGDLRGALGVGDGLAEAVRQEVGRTDDVREGGVEFPAAVAGEGLGFDEDRLGGSREGGDAGESEEAEGAGEHGI